MAKIAQAAPQIRKAALAYPDATEHHPWGENVAKVKGKVFVFLGVPGKTMTVTAKLPRSGGVALMLPFASPCAYGLGKSGWVTARFEPGDDVPVDMMLAWIEESYRAVAPAKLVKALDGGSVTARSRSPGAADPAPAGRPRGRAAPRRPAGHRPARGRP